ncbi:MAG: FecR domain-containing protein [Rhodospirillales bacterium]
MPAFRPRPFPSCLALALAGTLAASGAAAATDTGPAAAALTLRADAAQPAASRLIVAAPTQATVQDLSLVTTSDERIELLLSDGTAISLWGDSAVVVESFGDGKLALRLVRGTVRVVASPRTDTTVAGPAGVAQLAPGGAALLDSAAGAMRSVLLFGPGMSVAQAGADARIVRPGFAVASDARGIAGSPTAAEPAWLAARLASLAFPAGSGFAVSEADVVTASPAAGPPAAGVPAAAGEPAKTFDQSEVRQNQAAAPAPIGPETPALAPAAPSTPAPNPTPAPPTTVDTTPPVPTTPTAPTIPDAPTSPTTPTTPSVVVPPAPPPPPPELKLSFGQPLDNTGGQPLPPVQYISALNITSGSQSGAVGFTRFSVPLHFAHVAPWMEDLVAADAGASPIVRDRDPRLAGAASVQIDESYVIAFGIGTATIDSARMLLGAPIGVTVVNAEIDFFLGGGGSLRSGTHDFRVGFTGRGAGQVVPGDPDAFRVVESTRRTFYAVGPTTVTNEAPVYFMAASVTDRLLDLKTDPNDPLAEILLQEQGPFRTFYFGGLRTPDAGDWFTGGFHVTRYTDYLSLPLNATDVNTAGFIPGSLRIVAPALSADTQFLVAAPAAGAPAGAATVGLRAALQFAGAGATQQSVINVAVGDVAATANDRSFAGASVGSARRGGGEGSTAFQSGLATVAVWDADGPISMFGPTHGSGAPSHFVLSQGDTDGSIAPLGAAPAIYGIESVMKATAADAGAVADFAGAAAGRATAPPRQLTGYAGAIVESLPGGGGDGLRIYGLTTAAPADVAVTLDPARNRAAATFSLTGTAIGAPVDGADAAQFSFGGAGSAYVTGTTFAALGAPAAIGGSAAGGTAAMVSGEPLRAALPNNTALVEPSEYLQWGLWLADATTAGNRRDHVHLGSWVAGEATPVSALNGLAGQNVVAQYGGHAIGNVFSQAAGALYTAVGQFDATVSFAQRRVEASMSFDGRALGGGLDYQGGSSRFQGPVAGSGLTGTLRGSFFGPQAQAIGGAFSLQNAPDAASVYRAEGTFAATRKN